MIDSYDKLPLGDYLRIIEISGRSYDEDIERQLDILSILTGKSADELGDLYLPDYKDLVARSSFLEQECNLPDLKETYKVGDFELEYIKDYAKLTTAQYVDFQTFLAAGTSKLVETLSCLLVPKGHKYNRDYDVLEVQKALRENLMVADALALGAFFLELYVTSMADIAGSLAREAKTTSDPIVKDKLMQAVAQIKEEVLLLVGAGQVVSTL